MNESYRDDAFINSIIGEGTRFKGEFDLNGLLRIDGDFTGSIRTKGKVLVGRNGRAECTMHAGTVVIGGVMRGEIFSTEKVIILSTGLMLGNITSPRLIVEEGVIVHGTCTISPDMGVEKQAHGPAQAPAQNGAAAQAAVQSTTAPQVSAQNTSAQNTTAPSPQAHGQNGAPSSQTAQTAPQPAVPATVQTAPQPAAASQSAHAHGQNGAPPAPQAHGQNGAAPQGSVKPPQGNAQPPAQGMASPQKR